LQRGEVGTLGDTERGTEVHEGYGQSARARDVLPESVEVRAPAGQENELGRGSRVVLAVVDERRPDRLDERADHVVYDLRRGSELLRSLEADSHLALEHFRVSHGDLELGGD